MSDTWYYYHVRHGEGSEMKQNVGKKIFEKNMETRITIRVDEKHLTIINQLMKEKQFNSMSEAIRFIIENYQAKKNK